MFTRAQTNEVKVLLYKQSEKTPHLQHHYLSPGGFDAVIRKLDAMTEEKANERGTPWRFLTLKSGLCSCVAPSERKGEGR